jgi:cytolysin-activating lysine-acyltransferase
MMDLNVSVNEKVDGGEALGPVQEQTLGEPAASAGRTEPELSPLQLQKRRIAAKALSAAFGDIVSVLARAGDAKERTLSDLKWLVVPALTTGQYRLAEVHSKTRGFTAPAGVVLWASVSDEVDQRLSADPDAPIRLAPKEWKSGDNLWLVEAAGPPRILSPLLRAIAAKEWQGKRVKVRTRGADGKFVIHVIEGAKNAA